jgi:trigger factor
MRVLRQDNSPTNLVLTVTADASDLEPIKGHVLSHFRHTVKVPGFREGKAPDELVEKHANQQRLLDEFMEHAMNEMYRRAVERENLKPIATPRVQLKKFVPYTDLEFEAETEVLGPVKLPSYKTIKLPKPKPVVTAKDIDEVVKSLQTRMAERAPTDKPAKKGDEVVIDFKGTDKDGQAIPGADGKDYPLIIGSKSFIPGFEEELVGLKPGATTSFEITFPKDYGSEALQNKKVDFKVTVKKIQELKEPKVDDNFAAKVGPFKTAAELKTDIKRQLTEEKKRQADVDYQNQLLQKISEKTELEVPNSLIEEEVTSMEDQEKQNLAYQGQTWQEHLKSEGISEEEHRQRHRVQAQQRVKTGLLLTEIAEKEGLNVTPEEVEIRRQILKGQYQDPQMQAEIDKPQNLRDIEARLLTEKTIERLVSYANK